MFLDSQSISSKVFYPVSCLGAVVLIICLVLLVSARDSGAYVNIGLIIVLYTLWTYF